MSAVATILKIIIIIYDVHCELFEIRFLNGSDWILRLSKIFKLFLV